MDAIDFSSVYVWCNSLEIININIQSSTSTSKCCRSENHVNLFALVPEEQMCRIFACNSADNAGGFNQRLNSHWGLRQSIYPTIFIFQLMQLAFEVFARIRSQKLRAFSCLLSRAKVRSWSYLRVIEALKLTESFLLSKYYVACYLAAGIRAC